MPQPLSDKRFPPRLLLQWHITERCNLRCTHCYQEDVPPPDLPLYDLFDIFEQYIGFLQAPMASGWPAIPGHVTLTGGEPFLRPDFFDLLSHISQFHRSCSFAVLTNGSLIDKATAKQLRKLKPAFVQVSIDGGRETHDRIRGRGNFDRTVAAVRLLVGAGIRTLISFTVQRQNAGEFPTVARLGRRLKAHRVWADRFIPQGNARGQVEQVLSPGETRRFFESMAETRKRPRWRRRGTTEIAMHRALQFLCDGGTPYHCTAGHTLVAIQANGDLYPCRRMPVAVGNVLKEPLGRLYRESVLFRDLRNPAKMDDACARCEFGSQCRGGLRCLAYALEGSPFRKDPGCWVSVRSTSRLSGAALWRPLKPYSFCFSISMPTGYQASAGCLHNLANKG